MTHRRAGRTLARRLFIIMEHDDVTDLVAEAWGLLDAGRGGQALPLLRRALAMLGDAPPPVPKDGQPPVPVQRSTRPRRPRRAASPRWKPLPPDPATDPLKRHPNGSHFVKYRQRFYYFAKDPAAARQQYETWWRRIVAATATRSVAAIS